jgi:excisionase family DNA binding protein
MNDVNIKNDSETKTLAPVTPAAEAKRYVTKAEIAHRLRCTTRTIENWMLKGLPHYKFGDRKTLFLNEDVDAFMRDKFMVVTVK